MKKLIFAIFALALASCAKEQFSESQVVLPGQEITITATSGDPETRTERASDGSVLWSPGDQISLFYGSGTDGGSCFTAQNTETAKVANFTGTIGVITGGNDVSVEDTYFWATYPYNATASCDGASVTTVLPSEQVATADTFADDLFPSIGRSQGLNMAFYNICGGLKFTVSEEGIKSVTLKGKNGEQIAGRITVGFDDSDVPQVRGVAEGAEAVTLSAPEGETFEVGRAYYIVLVPTVFEKGFTLTFSKGTAQAVKERTAKTTIRRSVFGSLSAPDAGLEWTAVLDSETVPPDNEIWYTTTDGKIIDLEASYIHYNDKPFDCNVVNHVYQDGKGIIRCDGPITVINDHTFGNGRFTKINHIYLPNSIVYLRTGALSGIGVKELRLPDNLNYVGSYALSRISTLEKFIGKNVTADGRCVLFEECLAPNWGNTTQTVKEYLAAFAPAGLSSYEVPAEAEIIGWYAFSRCPELREIRFNEGLKTIYGEGISHNNFDCEITLPSSLESIGPYVFLHTKGIRGFYGNERFHTADHLCLVSGTHLEYFAGEDMSHYDIPEGIKSMENYAFDNLPNLTSVSFPSSMQSVPSSAFYNCPNLEMLYGECVSEDHKGIIVGKQYQSLLARKGVIEYTVPDGIESIGYNAFSNNNQLETIILPDTVKELSGYDFAWCGNLKKVVLSSNLERVNSCNPFLGSGSLEEIYFRSFIPPIYSDTQFYESDCTHLTVYVPEETLELYKQSGWSQYAPYMVGYKYDDIGEWNPDYYVSSDISEDGKVFALQASSTESAVNLILMGDGFSDRQIADGTYESVMRRALDAFFTEEPYKSFRNFFNVKYVNVVSSTEGYEHPGQALGTGFGSGTYVYGNDSKVLEYARKAVSDDELDDAVIIVMMNKDAYAGTCYMYNASSGDYGRGTSIAYFPTSSEIDTFTGLVSHEAGGHGFAKLADEYAYESMGDIPSDEINKRKTMEPYGWWKNVDFTSNPSQVKWSHFIADERYASENIGCYEGGLTYWTGVWRPTDASIMRYNTGGFNAPSRYAIWYRIGKLIYGESWEGSYEDFVTYDAVNRTPKAKARKAAQVRQAKLKKPLPPLPAPVVVGHSWREELHIK